MHNLSFFSRNKKKLAILAVLVVLIAVIAYFFLAQPQKHFFGGNLEGRAETPYGETLIVKIGVGGSTSASFYASIFEETNDTKYVVDGQWKDQSKVQFQVQVQVSGSNIQNIKVNYVKIKAEDNADNSYHEYSAGSYGYTFPDQIGTSPPASKTYTFPSSAKSIESHLQDCGASTTSATIKYYVSVEVQATGTKSGQTLTVTISYSHAGAQFATKSYQKETEETETTVTPNVLVTSFFSLQNVAYAAIIAGIIIIILATRELYRLSKRELTAEKKKKLRNLLKALIVAALIMLIMSSLFIYIFSKPPNDRAGNDTEWFSVRLIKDEHFTAAWQEGSNVQIKVTLQITYQNMQSTFTITIKVKAQDSSDASKYYEYPLYDAQDTYTSGQQKTYQTNVMTIEQHLQDLSLSTSESHTIDYYVYFKVVGTGTKSGEQYTIEHQYSKEITKTYTYYEPTPEITYSEKDGTQDNKVIDGDTGTYYYASKSSTSSYIKATLIFVIGVSGDWSDVELSFDMRAYYRYKIGSNWYKQYTTAYLYLDGNYKGSRSSSTWKTGYATKTWSGDFSAEAADGQIEVKLETSSVKAGDAWYVYIYVREMSVTQASASWFAFLFVPQNLLIIIVAIAIPGVIIFRRRRKEIVK